MTEPLGPDAHLGLDRIADLEEGLLSPGEEQAARAHLAGCEECQADLAALADVHEALLADAEITMPDDVAARLYAALAEMPPLAPAAAAATTLPVRTGPSRWERTRKPVLITLAAAAGITLLTLGIIHLPRSEQSTASSAAGTSAAAAATTAAAPQVLHSGHNYNAKTLGADGAALVSPPSSGAAAAATGAAAAATSAAATSAAAAAATSAGAAAAAPRPSSAAAPTSTAALPAAPAPTTDALAQLRDPGAAQRCVALLLGSTTPPRILDYATFDGKPAVIAVVDDAHDPGKLAVIAVGPPGCGLYSLNFVSKP